jgi:lipopolysaccharide exporter
MSTAAQPERSVTAGAAWMIAARFAERLLGLASTLVLARLLTPTDFGLVAMAMVFVAGAELLGAFGLDWALVRQPNIDRRHLNTAWTIRVLLGVTSATLLFIAADPAAAFYQEPRIAEMIWVLGASLLIAALENPGVIMFRREMNFSKEFQLRTSAKLAGAVVSICLAVALRSYWALLWGLLAARLVSTGVSYSVHPHRPAFSLAARRDLLQFSIWLWVANLLTFLRTRVIELIVGRLEGARSLGLFSIASELANLASTEFAAPINRVLFSRYSTHGTDAAAVGSAFASAAPVIWAVALPLVIATHLAAPEIIHLVVGDQWRDAVPLLQTLALAGAVGLFSVGSVHVYWAINRARLEVAVELWWVACLLPLLVVLVQARGLLGAAEAVLISNFALLPVNALLLRRYARVSIGQLLARGLRPCVAASAMWFTTSRVFGAELSLDTITALTRLVGIGLSSAVVYVLVLFGLWKMMGSPAGPEREIISQVTMRFGAIAAKIRGAPAK